MTCERNDLLGQRQKADREQAERDKKLLCWTRWAAIFAALAALFGLIMVFKS